MEINSRIERPAIHIRLLVYLINILFVIASTFCLYFAVFIPSFSATSKYVDDKNNVTEILETYDLKRGSGAPYSIYKGIIENVYFNMYPNEIIRDYSSEKTYSITYIYNVLVLQLPANPDATNYKTTFFHYEMDNAGKILVDQIGVVNSDLTDVGYANLSTLMYSKYSNLPSVFYEYNESYKTSLNNYTSIEATSRVSSLAIAFLIIYILLPLCFKNGALLGDVFFFIGYVDKKGYSIKKYKIILRGFLFAIFPLLGIYYLSTLMVSLLICLPIFIDVLVMIFSRTQTSLIEYSLFILPADVRTSLIFKNEKEEKEFSETSLGNFSDADYTAKLSSLDNFKTDSEGNKNERY